MDDDKATCDLLRACLSEGYEVIGTEDPEPALGLALEHKPDATCGWGETMILRSVSGRCVPTRRLNVRSPCSGRGNDRPRGEHSIAKAVSPKNS